MLRNLDPAATKPDISRPDPAKVISGDPVHSTWNLYQQGGLYCGIWQSTPGAWRVSYEEWEYVNILAGHSVLHGADGQRVDLHAGDRWIIEPGFVGVWEVV